MIAIEPLGADYAHARAAFVIAADEAGARRSSFAHPGCGPDGEELAVDVAELGPADASTVVLVVSATHGVEGYCGSALQRHWLSHHVDDRPEHVRVVHLHALNPYGMAWVRRVNEDNVDLNRNFVDWTGPPPANVDYDRIADVLVPAEWTPIAQERTTGELLALAGEWGFERLQAVISGGQYTHPTGIFYGGTGPVWSHRFLRRWSADALAAAERVIIIDLHTGLGPWGVGELIASASRGTPHHERATAMWGDVRSMLDGDSVSAALSGDWLAIVDELAPHAEVTPICIEYGTVDPVTVLQALRADAWLHAHGDPRGNDSPAVRDQVRAAFADDDPAWLDGCWRRFHDVIGAALGG
jgi:hypothetical protein